MTMMMMLQAFKKGKVKDRQIDTKIENRQMVFQSVNSIQISLR